MKEDRIKQNEEGGVCRRCDAPISYSKEFDAHYCSQCNIWLEEKCVDPLCEFCKCRPIRPIKKNTAKIKKKRTKAIEWKM